MATMAEDVMKGVISIDQYIIKHLLFCSKSSWLEKCVDKYFLCEMHQIKYNIENKMMLILQ